MTSLVALQQDRSAASLRFGRSGGAGEAGRGPDQTLTLRTESRRSASVVISLSGAEPPEEAKTPPSPFRRLADALKSLKAQIEDIAARGGPDQPQAVEAPEGEDRPEDPLEKLDRLLTALKDVLADKDASLGDKLKRIATLGTIAKGEVPSEENLQDLGDALARIRGQDSNVPQDVEDGDGRDAENASDNDGPSFSLTHLSRTVDSVIGLAEGEDGPAIGAQLTHEVTSGFEFAIAHGRATLTLFSSERISGQFAAQAYGGPQERPSFSASA